MDTLTVICNKLKITNYS